MPLLTRMVYAAFVLEMVRRIKNNISIGQLMESDEVEALEENLRQSLVSIDSKLTIEDVNNFTLREDLKGS